MLHANESNPNKWIIQTIVSCWFTLYLLLGLCMGRCVQVAIRPRKGSERVSGLQRERRLWGDHGYILSQRWRTPPTNAGHIALHRLLWQPKLPWPSTFGDNCSADCEVCRPQWQEYRLPVWARRSPQAASTRRLRRSPVLFGAPCEGAAAAGDRVICYSLLCP